VSDAGSGPSRTPRLVHRTLGLSCEPPVRSWFVSFNPLFDRTMRLPMDSVQPVRPFRRC
jgi:hypothetical protein